MRSMHSFMSVISNISNVMSSIFNIVAEIFGRIWQGAVLHPDAAHRRLRAAQRLSAEATASASSRCENGLERSGRSSVLPPGSSA